MRRHPENWIECIQGSAEWFNARVGMVTASRAAEAVSMLKNGGSSKGREKYKVEILTEILTGKPVEHYVSPAMDFGIEYEPVARSVYEMHMGVEVEQWGFVIHPTISRAGASPDGLVGADGLVEIKVPLGTTHMQYLDADVVPEEYIPQMDWQMACTERKWCDFVSYDPRIPDDFSLFVKRRLRNEQAIAELEVGVRQFLAEVGEMAERLLRRSNNGALKAWQGMGESLEQRLAASVKATERVSV